MKKKELIFVLLALFFITAFFFYKVFLYGHIPFPGDLLISEYSPFKYYSYLDYNPGSYPNKAQYFDVIRQLYPWKMLAIDMWKSGQIPLWNPYNFAGSPLLANNQSAVFYPLNLLFFAFKPVVSWCLYIILQPFLASFFTYLYLRRIGLRSFSSLFASVAYGFSLFMSVFLEYGNYGHSMIWLPFIFYCVYGLHHNNKYSGALLSLSVACLLFAGHLQIAFAILLISCFYTFYLGITNNRERMSSVLKTVPFFILGIGIASVQLLPTIELLQNSARVSHDIRNIMENFLIAPAQYILLFIPDFFGNPATRNYLLKDSYPGNALYIGMIPILFALFAFLFVRKNPTLKFFGISSVLILLFITKTPFALFFYSLKLPVIATSSPGNYVFLLSFCFAVAAGIGIEEWTKKSTKQISYVLGIVGVIFLTTFVTSKLLHVEYIQKQYILSFGLFIVAAFLVTAFYKLKKQVGSYVFIIFLCADLFYFFIKFNPFVPASFLYPKTEIVLELKKFAQHNRIAGFKGATIESNFATELKLLSADGYDPLYPRAYSDYISQAKSGARGKNDFALRSDAVLPFEDNISLANEGELLRAFNELGVKYILNRVENGATEHTFPPEVFDLVYKKDGWEIFENKNSLPRAYILSPENKVVPVKIEEYSPNRVVIVVPAGLKGELVFSDTYFNGWRVYVDEEQRFLNRAGNVFRGVSVLEGDKKVVFVYKPVSFSIGLTITIISIVITFGFIFFTKKNKHET